MSKASHRDIIEALYARGGDLGELEAKVRRDFIGIGTAETLPVSREEFRAGRSRRFGTANPEHMRVPFWNAMVRCGWPAYFGAKHFGDEECSVCCLDGKRDPVWCHDRFGMSLTRLPDGRFIQIAGEHEDHYDPDFCIYNDVFIHDGKGGFEILGYPEDVFPPTDFHSATLVAPWIYIIGNLGYLDHRGRETPVFRLHTETGGIERVATRGTSPGWIHRHRATLVNGRIRVSGGKLFTTTADGNSDLVDNPAPGELDLATLTWQPCAP